MATRITSKANDETLAGLNTMLEKRQMAVRFKIDSVNGYYNIVYRKLGDNCKCFSRNYSTCLTAKEVHITLVTLCDGLMLANGAEI